jgi:hypothetical protein
MPGDPLDLACSIQAALHTFAIPPAPLSVRKAGNGILFRFAEPRQARKVLQDRGLFRQGPLGVLHGRQVGGLDTEFRSKRSGPEYSLHVVLGRGGLVFADLDRFNPYQNATSLVLHGALELFPHLARRLVGFWDPRRAFRRPVRVNPSLNQGESPISSDAFAD